MLLASESASMTVFTGLAIAMTGMLIVLSALILISLALMALPKVLAVLNEYYPEKPDHLAASSQGTAGTADHETAAAAAFATHLHRGRTI